MQCFANDGCSLSVWSGSNLRLTFPKKEGDIWSGKGMLQSDKTKWKDREGERETAVSRRRKDKLAKRDPERKEGRSWKRGETNLKRPPSTTKRKPLRSGKGGG